MNNRSLQAQFRTCLRVAVFSLVVFLTGGTAAAQAIPDAEAKAPASIAIHGLSLPLLPRASLGNVEAREFYLEGLRQLTTLNEFLKTQPLSAEQRATQLIETRNALRTEARALMADRELADLLNVTDPNMTIAQLVQRAESKGLSGNALWEELANSASRSRASVNQSLGVKP